MTAAERPWAQPGADPAGDIREAMDAAYASGEGMIDTSYPAGDCLRDTDGTILSGPCLPCGCPLDAGCDGWHPGRRP